MIPAAWTCSALLEASGPHCEGALLSLLVTTAEVGGQTSEETPAQHNSVFELCFYAERMDSG